MSTGDPPRWRLSSAVFGVFLLMPALHAQLERHLPIYDAQDKIVYAKVRVADGSPLPGIPGVEALCGGVAYPLGYTDTQGNFRVVVRNGASAFGASFNSNGATMSLSALANCEFRALAPGYSSQRVSPRWLREMSEANTVSLGSILLSRPADAHGELAHDAHVPKAARNAYKKGGSAMADRKWGDAKAQFEQAVGAHPGYVAAWVALGLADEALEQWKDAESAYQHAIKLSPNSAGPYLRIARLRATAGEWQPAALYSETAIGLDPQNLVEGYSLCAMANLKLGHLETARSSARAGLKLKNASDCPDLWLTLALAEAAGKRYADAAAGLQMYLKLVPRAEGNPEVQKELAELRGRLPR
ncbi:MAG TPA: tetratricopeptide repeat protein [Bryobacteraceae bacterium]|nr:tetratricopeptide repeat protein [Bryobacteraceae bacterium]